MTRCAYWVKRPMYLEAPDHQQALAPESYTKNHRDLIQPFRIGNPLLFYAFKQLLVRNVYHNESCKEKDIPFEYSSEYVKKGFGYRPITTTPWEKFLNIADLD